MRSRSPSADRVSMVSGHSQLVGNDSQIVRNDPPLPVVDQKNKKQVNNYVIPETRESAETEHNNLFLGISQSAEFNKGKKTGIKLTRPEEFVISSHKNTPTSSNATRNR